MFFQSVSRRTALGAVALAAAIAITAPQAISPNLAFAQQERPESFADLAERLLPAVVNISTAQNVEQPSRPLPQLPPGSPFEDLFRDFFDRGQRGEGPRTVQSLGSGFIIDPSGVVVTNNHVIEEADEIEVILQNGDALPAQLIGRDPKTDLAVLKVSSDVDLPFVPFGDSEKSRVGDWVLAIGNPFGFGGSVSAGIISARNRDINSGPYDDFIQTDAAINRGNSGGPLFNLDGEVIGVNTAIISPSGGSIGIGFSVPASLAENVVAQLREFGETRRGWLGVRIQSLDEAIAENLGLSEPVGALVSVVDDTGPAGAAGIQTGDVILSFDGKDIEEMKDLPRIVAETPVGDTVDVEVFRDEEVLTLPVTVALLDEGGEGEETSEATEPEAADENPLSMRFEDLTRANRAQYSIDQDIRGVLIAEVDPASAASERGIRAGDVLVEVGQKEVESPADASEQIAIAEEAGKKSVLLMINRQGALRFVAVEFEK
ncbi:MAG: DegQ family serine endoprotease [Pseudomonadota bacterium]